MKDKLDINLWVSEQHTCECCGKIMTEYYGSGRFCSSKCARSFSTSAKRKEINEKVSESLKGRKYSPSKAQKESLKRLHTDILPKVAELKRQTRFVKVGNDTLDITAAQLENYRKTHTVCDICGKPETIIKNGKLINLAIDHDHETKKFRGLVCNHCNTKLAWFDKYKTKILNFVDTDYNFK